MIAIFGFLIVVILSITVVRIGAIALELTGLSPEVASFQAQSAFSGAGFTTAESESIVTHPVRRRIARLLILFGTAGLTSSIGTFVLTFVGQSGKGLAIRSGILVFGLLLIYLLSRSKILYYFMKKIIVRVLEHYTLTKIYDYQEILGIEKGYNISRIVVKENSWMSGCRLQDLNLYLEGVLVLSINRVVNGEDKFIGAPKGETIIYPGDILVCYGKEDVSKKLSQRTKGKKGDIEHAEEVKTEQRKEKERAERGGYS